MLFVVFQLGADRYALPAERVVEVLPLLAWKAVPGAPRGIAGVIDYRGTVVPLVDLSERALGRPAERCLSTRILVTRYDGADDAVMWLALIAEHATDVVRLDETAFAPNPVQGDAAFRGPVARDGRGLLQRIDVGPLLDEATRAALYPARAAQGAAP